MPRASLSWLTAWFALVACGFVTTPALAGVADDDRAAAEALYARAEQDEAALDFPSAVKNYEASLARSPASQHAQRASRRVLDLKTHAEGNFAPLVRLETIRRSPSLSNEPSAIDALVVDAAAFPAGRVRVEARMLAAEAYLGRMHRKRDALALLRLVAADPNAELVTARDAAGELLAASTDERDYTGALVVADAFPKLLPPGTRKNLVRLARRGPLGVLAWADLALLAAFAVVALGSSSRGRAVAVVVRLAPTALVFAALCAGLGGLLASRYEASSPYPFAALGPVLFVLFLLSRAASAGAASAWPLRGVRVLVSFVAVFAAAFLLLGRMDPIYLSGFGL